MKPIFKKYLICISCAVVAILTGLGIYLGVSHSNPPALDVSINNFDIKVGEKVKIEYDVSISDAVIFLDVDKNQIASLIQENGINYLTGCSEGKANLTLIAKYRNQKVEKVAKVVVSAVYQKPSEGDNTGSEDTKDPTKPENPDKDDEKEDTEKEDALLLEFLNVQNCSIEKNVINMKQSVLAIFSVSANISITNLHIDLIAADLSDDFVQEIGNNTFCLLSDISGDFEIDFVVNNQFRLRYHVIIK